MRMSGRSTLDLEYREMFAGGASEQIGQQTGREEAARPRLTLGNGFHPVGTVECTNARVRGAVADLLQEHD